MEDEIEAGAFLEHGLYGEHLYGTKFESVRRVIQSGKMCVLDVEPTVRKKSRTSIQCLEFINHGFYPIGFKINL